MATVIITFSQLGEALGREGHMVESFATGIGDFTVERENFGDAYSPMLTHVLSDDGMRAVAGVLRSWHSAAYREAAEEFDGDTEAFMGSSFGEQVWEDYERIVHGFVPYLDELDTGRFQEGDRVFDIDGVRYGTIREVGKGVAVFEDGTRAELHYLLKESDEIFGG